MAIGRGCRLQDPDDLELAGARAPHDDDAGSSSPAADDEGRPSDVALSDATHVSHPTRAWMGERWRTPPARRSNANTRSPHAAYSVCDVARMVALNLSQGTLAGGRWPIGQSTRTDRRVARASHRRTQPSSEHGATSCYRLPEPVRGLAAMWPHATVWPASRRRPAPLQVGWKPAARPEL